MRKNKGITLVALIITIVIMLILVIVSGRVLINSNLIGMAEKAANEYKVAQEQEANDETIEINGKKYDSIEDYLEGKESIPEIHNWVRTGDNIKCEHCNTNLTIGQQLNYTKTGTGISKVSGEMSGVSQGITDDRLITSDFGINGEQTINKDSETKWVVLGIEDSNKNGTNETLLLTTLKPTEDTIVMYGYKAYYYAIDEINRMCKEIYGEDARGITIEDVNNCLDYTPGGGMYELNDTWNSIGNLDTKLKDIPNWNNIRYIQTPDGVNTEEALGEYLLDGYGYAVDITYEQTGVPELPDSTTTATITLIFGADYSYDYWLASRGVCANSDYVSFGPGTVNGNRACSFECSFVSEGFSRSSTCSLRAVVSLRTEIPDAVEL